MKKILLIITLLLTASNLFSISSEDFTIYIMHFFQNRTNEIVDITIDYFQDVDELSPELTNIYLAFYSTLFEDDNIKKDIMAVIDEKANEKVKGYFNTISRTNIDDYYVKENYSPELNDMIWASYFAYGDVKYLKILYKIIDGSSLKDFEKNLFYTRVSAAWSMGNNSQQFNEVQEYLEMKNTEIAKLLLSNTQEDFDLIVEKIKDEEKL